MITLLKELKRKKLKKGLATLCIGGGQGGAMIVEAKLMTKSINLIKHDNYVELQFDMPNSKVNILSKEVLEEFDKLIEKIKKEIDLKSLVLTIRNQVYLLPGQILMKLEV